MIIVDFIDVGHANACFTLETTEPLTEEFILSSVAPHCGSRMLEALKHNEQNHGIILAGGLRTIGRFEFRIKEKVV